MTASTRTDQATDWWADLYARVTTDDELAANLARVAARNERLERRLAKIPDDTDHRERLLRSLAHAVLHGLDAHAHDLAQQEKLTR